MIDEIEMLKRDALQKLNELDDKISNGNRNVPSKSSSASTSTSTSASSSATRDDPTDISNASLASSLGPAPKPRERSYSTDVFDESEAEYMMRRLGERIKKDENPNATPTSTPPNVVASQTRTRGRKRDETLLDNTSWKLSLDIGREPGTWMPKDWGVSGSRLKIDFEFEFSDRQLYEREDFLGSMGDAKIVSVKDSKMVLSPSITEGTKEIAVKDGGWRVSKGKGPMGSDLLRFYVEIDEEVSRTGGDVYCPAGRIYCSCGFFNMDRPSNGEKAMYKKRLDDLIDRAEALDEEILQAGFLGKLQKNAQMIKLKVEMQETAERYRGASAIEPDTSILRFSPEGDVGLTKEGGVCCKVEKNMATEYHILGRFYIQSKR
jgi:hypothetical protein